MTEQTTQLTTVDTKESKPWRVELAWFNPDSPDEVKCWYAVHFDFATEDEAKVLLASFRPNENARVEMFKISFREPESIEEDTDGQA